MEGEFQIPDDDRDRCPTCGGDRQGALFECPHCGADGTSVQMTLSEGDLHEYEHQKMRFGSEKRRGWINAIFGFWRGG